MVVQPIFVSDFFVYYLLPFLLVFTLTFAVLQKSKLFGGEAQKINLVLGMIIGALLIAFPYPRDIVVKLMPYLAVTLTIIFIFLLLYGFAAQKGDNELVNRYMRIVLGGLIVISLIVVLLMVSGFWDKIFSWSFGGNGGSKVWLNGLMVIVIAGAVIAVIRSGEGVSSKSK